jgi:hypothetical protein
VILSTTLEVLGVLAKVACVTAAVYVTGSALVGGYLTIVVEPYRTWRSSR